MYVTAIERQRANKLQQAQRCSEAVMPKRQPPMEEKKATPNRKVGIRPFNANNCARVLVLSECLKLGRKKSHSLQHFHACTPTAETAHNYLH